MDFESLPPYVLMKIVEDWDLNEIITLCESSKTLNNLLCENDDFWQQRLKQDFGDEEYEFISEKFPRSWKEAYQNQSKGRVWSFGENGSGELGLGDNEDRNSPNLITSLDKVKIKDVSSGDSNSLVLDDQGRVWSFGSNYYHQLGHGSNKDRKKPTLIKSLIRRKVKINAISAGSFFNLILDDKGRVWSFGTNFSGGLGLGGPEKRKKPTLIKSLVDAKVKIKAISVGFKHGLVLDEEGKVWSFGNNYYGQLGLGDEVNRNSPTLIQSLNKIKAISAGAGYSLVLDEEGKVWSFGNNYYGQLGLGDEVDRNVPTPIQSLVDNEVKIKAISAGGDNSLLLDEEGKVWSFGSNNIGQLGLGDEVYRNVPTLIQSLNNIKAVSSDYEYCLVLDEEGKVWSFGSNQNGKLGLGDEVDRNGKLGLGDEVDRNVPTLIKSLIDDNIKIKAISAGTNHSLILERSEPILTKYQKITELLNNNQITEFSWRQDLQYLTAGPNSIFEFVDNQGNVYLAEVLYGSNNIYLPLYQTTYSKAVDLINNNKVTSYEINQNHQVYLQNSNNQIITLVTENKQILVEVQYKDENIYPPL